MSDAEIHRHDGLFRILGIFLGIATNAEWAELLGYDNASSISRIRTGKNDLPEQKKRLLAQKCGISRTELDLSLDQLSSRLQIEDDVPIDVVQSSKNFSASDVKIIDSLQGRYLILYPGRDYETADLDIIIVEELEIDKVKVGGNFSNCKEVLLKKNFVTGKSVMGRMQVFSGVVFIQLRYVDDPYPPSTMVAQIVSQNANGALLTGLYLDVTGEQNPRIFSTQFCMFSYDEKTAPPRKIQSTDLLFERWKDMMDNKITSRNKLTSKTGDHVLDELTNLVAQTKRGLGVGNA
jgi:hypothetical protein